MYFMFTNQFPSNSSLGQVSNMEPTNEKRVSYRNINSDGTGEAWREAVERVKVCLLCDDGRNLFVVVDAGK